MQHARLKAERRLSGRVLDRSARAPRVGAHALRVDAAMATRLRVAVVGQFSPPELIKINLDGDATSVRAALVLRAWEAQARVHARVYARVVRREIFARLRRAPIEIVALRATRLISYIQ